MLESVNNEAFEGPCVQHLVVVNVELVQRMDAFNLTEQNKRIQEVVREYELLELGELAKFVQVGMVNNQIKSSIGQVHFLHHIVEL